MGWNNQVVNLIILTEQTTGFSGIFGYSPSVGAGNLIFSVSAVAGTDPYGNPYPAGISATQGLFTGDIQAASIVNTVLTGSTFQGGNMVDTAITFDASGGSLLVYGSTVNTQTFTTGSGNWTAPATVTSVRAECWGAGAGSSVFGGAGGGGEYAAEYTLAVTAGNSYAYVVGAAGQAGVHNGASSTSGSNTTFAGDSVTVTSHGGARGGGSMAGGSGSTNTVHFSGGAGGSPSSITNIGNPTGATVGGGGGGAAGSSGSGGNGAGGGTSVYPGSANAGGVAGTGGGAGGAGAVDDTNGTAGSAPGGGGGAPGTDGEGDYGLAANGAAGKVTLTWLTGRSLITSIAPAAGTDSYGNSYPIAIGADQYYVQSVSVQPTAPGSGCFLYYTGGALYAVGASNAPVKIATT